LKLFAEEIKTIKQEIIKLNYINKIIIPYLENRIFLFNVLTMVLLIIVGFLTYHNIFDNSYHFDDSVWKTLDQVVNEDYVGLFDFNVFRVIPFATLTHNFHFFGEETAGYYYVNLIIHILNAFLCFIFIQLILRTPALKDNKIAKYAPLIAFFGAMIFLTHPIQTQAVSYIYQRLASIAAFFYIATCILYLSFRLSSVTYKKINYLALGIFTLILGLFSKENTFTLPLTIACIEFFLMHRRFKVKIWLIIVFIAIIAGLILLAKYALGFDIIFMEQKSPYDEIITSENYLLTQFRVVWTYWRLLFLPYGQHLDYYYPLSESFFEFWTFFAFIMHIFVIVIGVLAYKKHRLVSFGIFWFYITLLVESSVIPIRDVIFEHRLYLPIIGFILIVLYLIFYLSNKKIMDYVVIFLVVIITLYSYLSYQRNIVWHNDGTLWTDSVRKSPENSRAWNNRGLYFLKKDQHEIAIKNFSKAIELKPNYAEPYSNRATSLFFIQEYERSLSDFNKCIEINPKIPDIYANRANVFMILNDYKSAIDDLNRVKNSQPDDPYSYIGLARSYREINDYPNAIVNYEKFLELDPKNIPSYINLAICYSLVDSIDKSIETLDRGLAINHDNTKLLFNKAKILLKHGRNEEATGVLNKIREIEPNYPGLNELIRK
jgi:protein O-mannosyl-transferase